MNYSTDVKFSNNLVKKGKTTITYSGSLFRTESDAVTLVYGFGDNWENTTEKEMTKNENNFSVEIDLLDFDKINFCFRNSNNIWDNNNYLNYVAPISEPEKEYDFIINENLVEGIVDNLLETNLSTYENTEAPKVEVENIVAEENQSIAENVELAEENQSVDSAIELIENDVVSEESFDIEIPDETPADIQEFIGETKEEPTLTNDLEAAFYALFEDSNDDKKENIVNFDMDSIVDEILSPLAEAKEENKNYEVSVNLTELELASNFSEAFTQEISAQEETVEEGNIQEISIEENSEDTIQEVTVQEDSDIEENIQEASTTEETVEESLLQDLNTETALIEVNEGKNSLLVSPRSLSKLYILKKKIKLAVYKFFTAIPKIIESSFGEEKN